MKLIYKIIISLTFSFYTNAVILPDAQTLFTAFKNLERQYCNKNAPLDYQDWKINQKCIALGYYSVLLNAAGLEVDPIMVADMLLTYFHSNSPLAKRISKDQEYIDKLLEILFATNAAQQKEASSHFYIGALKFLVKKRIEACCCIL